LKKIAETGGLRADQSKSRRPCRSAKLNDRMKLTDYWVWARIEYQLVVKTRLAR